MAVNVRSSIVVKDIRTSRFLFWYIRNNIQGMKQFAFDGNNPDTALSERIINTALEVGCPDPIQRSQFISTLELAINTTLLPEKYFSWLKENERATFWLWGLMCLDSRCMESINKKLGTNSHWYQKAGLTDSPVSHSERYSIIVALLDFINIETNQAPLMRQWLYDRLVFWRANDHQQVKLRWLTQDHTDVCTWAYNYIKKFQKEHASGEGNKLDPVQIPEPLNSVETFHSIFAMLDLWSAGDEIQEKAIRKINKAFYQKNFRRKQSEKRERDSISDAHKDRLNSLAEFYKSDKISVIERLIDERVQGIEVRLSRG
ncbi:MULTISPECIES: hypothetical protein [Enterobacteriaceae]|uniref:hypothetical protein n=1 Tax=Enterobacteriaceae TaxID=543 RepID=UPI000B40FFFC|nr:MULTISPECIES: hypothetical protein [Enterobacteriaceae]RNV96164.1 hypothetical protein CAF89_015930 [Enterobacter asburiae]